VNLATLTLALVGFWFFVLPTRLGGLSTYTVVSGPSMEPTYHTGDLVLARRAKTYRLGQVVVYAVPDRKFRAFRVVHRVTQRTIDNRYVTKGDNQVHPDPWLVPHDDIAGGRVLSVPKAGYLLAYMHNPLYLGLVFGLSVVFVAWPRTNSSSVKALDEASERADAIGVAEAIGAADTIEAVNASDDNEGIELSDRRAGSRPLPERSTGTPATKATGAAHGELEEFIRGWADMFAESKSLDFHR
jgi:signal peptidase I